ncbi:Ankyrin repeat domain-containing protein 17 [Hondaea fermentalgiana]|uniref:Ankyrin repeat domain-containing protein 17 n=1 Tax=Hondaea fermentalgiana TaxID=2315210 RepID=A0A2R5GG22_9STRA|nr:Ankyrin repeat domain-containing protein 17 [Hondaea fermentalgiana]|eukprot:GBG28718.1 Ankyrin repeat domain-containing protein 17 [Hondaea fermentalgiana]
MSSGATAHVALPGLVSDTDEGLEVRLRGAKHALRGREFDFRDCDEARDAEKYINEENARVVSSRKTPTNNQEDEETIMTQQATTSRTSMAKMANARSPPSAFSQTRPQSMTRTPEPLSREADPPKETRMSSETSRLLFRTAIDEDAVDAVQTLLHDARVDPGDELSEGLIRVARKGNRFTDMAAVLLGDKRCDVTFADNKALLVAVREGAEFVVRLLLCSQALDAGAQGNKALCIACEHGEAEIVKALLNFGRGVSVEAQDNMPLILAASSGKASIVGYLLRRGAEWEDRIEPAAQNGRALREAAARGHTDVVRILLREVRRFPSAHRQAALLAASSGGHLETVRLLLRNARVEVESDDYEVICRALRGGHHKTARALARHARVRLSRFEQDTRSAPAGAIASSQRSDVPAPTCSIS